MNDTDRRPREPGTPETGSRPPAEFQVRISCRGRNADAVLDDLGHALADGEARTQDPLIVLEDLGQLADSIMTLMKGVSRRLVNYPRTVTFWESSGYAEAFLSAMEPRPPA